MAPLDWPQYILSLIAALGGGLTVREVIGAVGRVRSGKTTAERVQNKSLIARTRRAEAIAQYERTWRIQIQDHAAICRRVAVEYGAHPQELGPWPPPPDLPPEPAEDVDTSTI